MYAGVTFHGNMIYRIPKSRENRQRKKPFRMDGNTFPCERAFWISGTQRNAPPAPKHLGEKIRNQTTKGIFFMAP